MHDRVLQQLVDMSRYLGDPGKTYAILGEGNTSARVSDDVFYVKASGTTLATIDTSGFVAVSISKVTSILDDPTAGDDAVTETFKRSLVEPNEKRRPSVEAMLHALLYKYLDINFIGHTHPVFTNMLLCSTRAEEAVTGRICPDHIVLMAHKSVYIPYVDPGLVLARETRKRVEAYLRDENMAPRAIMMQNHGIIALGKAAKDVMGITDMAEKISRIIFGTYALGGPAFMPRQDVERIFTRPDEKYREKIIGPSTETEKA
jgi:rhamnose utilization protein RhaD (predicted bifunctional aldolase and dehydrogenase)